MNCGSSPRVDDRFTAFADASRRTVLSTLCDRPSAEEPPTASIETLAAELASEGRCDGRTDGGGDGRAARGGARDDAPDASPTLTNARIELLHVHLPGLERAGLVESDAEEVRLAAEPDVVEHGLELAEEFERTL